MRVIKRYPNRKLYDTARRRYITLEGIGELVRQGGEVRVVDHTTGQDLTNAVLSQILHEREKARPGLPRTLLSQILQGGGRLRRMVSGGIDAFLSTQLEAAVRRLGLPTRRELAALQRRLRALERKLRALEADRRRVHSRRA